MSGFATASFLTGLGVCFAALAAVFGLAYAAGRRVDRVNVVDVAWGLGFVAVAVAAYLWSPGDPTRKALVLSLVGVWGLRLAGYIGWRSRGHGEDRRYAALAERAGKPKWRWATVNVFGLQAVIAWVISLPVQTAMAIRDAPSALTVVGGAIWLVGVAFEAVGDAQLAAFRADPGSQGQVMDRGLWRYTRHPNYFGDFCVWVGLYLVAAQAWQGAVTVISPVAMGYFLLFVTGKPMLERDLARRRPGYADYMQRTSGFFPLPPRRPASQPGGSANPR